MISVHDRARRFAELHVKGSPLVLYDIWNAGSARAVAEAGADAIGTSSWAVAHALGYRAGEQMPKALNEEIVAGIAEAVTVPVTVDLNGSDSDDVEQLTENVERLLHFGVVGIDLDDRLVRQSGLYSISRQAKRIAAVRKAAAQKGGGLFINLQTGLFRQARHDRVSLIDEAVERAAAYADAGASGFCAPGLQHEAQLARICERVSLPVSVIYGEGTPSHDRLARLGVARISYGNAPYLRQLETLRAQAEDCFRANDIHPIPANPRVRDRIVPRHRHVANDNADGPASVGHVPGPS